MRVTFDQEADALYVRLDKSHVAETEEIRPGVILDFDERGEIVGLEILRVGERLSPAELKRMDFELL